MPILSNDKRKLFIYFRGEELRCFNQFILNTPFLKIDSWNLEDFLNWELYVTQQFSPILKKPKIILQYDNGIHEFKINISYRGSIVKLNKLEDVFELFNNSSIKIRENNNKKFWIIPKQLYEYSEIELLETVNEKIKDNIKGFNPPKRTIPENVIDFVDSLKKKTINNLDDKVKSFLKTA